MSVIEQLKYNVVCVVMKLEAVGKGGKSLSLPWRLKKDF